MEKVGNKFRSHRESEQADLAYYRSLTPNERLAILPDLIDQAQGNEAEQGFARVYRVVKLHDD